MLVLGRLSEARAQHLLYDEYRTQLATETAPTGALDYNGKPVVEGSPVALMSIPAIGALRHGRRRRHRVGRPARRPRSPAHHAAARATSGTSLVMGRSTTYGAPFARHHVAAPRRPRSRWSAPRAPSTYTVKDVRSRRRPDPAARRPGKSAGRLILATADSTGFLSALRPRDVVYVDADTSKAYPSGPVYPLVPDGGEGDAARPGGAAAAGAAAGLRWRRSSWR